jgi:hypothetical protein
MKNYIVLLSMGSDTGIGGVFFSTAKSRIEAIQKATDRLINMYSKEMNKICQNKGLHYLPYAYIFKNVNEYYERVREMDED